MCKSAQGSLYRELGSRVLGLGFSVTASANDLAIWTGVIGAAVGGLAGFGGAWLQAQFVQREGQADRAHDRRMRFLEDRSAAYLVVMEYVGRVITMVDAWADGRETVEAVEGVWQGDPWQVMMAQLRTYGSEEVMTAFLAFDTTVRLLPHIPKPRGELGKAAHALAEQLQKTVHAEVHPPG